MKEGRGHTGLVFQKPFESSHTPLGKRQKNNMERIHQEGKAFSKCTRKLMHIPPRPKPRNIVEARGVVRGLRKKPKITGTAQESIPQKLTAGNKRKCEDIKFPSGSKKKSSWDGGT